MSHDDRASYLYGRDITGDRRYRPCPDMRVNLYQNMIEEDELDEHEHDDDAGDAAADADANKENTGSSGNLAGTTSATAAAAAAASTSHSSAVDDAAAAVVLRLRPTANKCADFSFERNVFKHRTPITTDCNQAKVPEKHFRFHSIFPEQTSQAVVYRTCVQDAIENDDALTVMTYGTSGSGKTFTLLGIHSDNPGIIPRAIEHIFARYGASVCTKPAVKVECGTVIPVTDDRMRQANALRHALIGRRASTAATAAAQQQATANGVSAIDRSAEAYVPHKQRIADEHQFQLSPLLAAETTVFIWVSFAEIYNESVFDLLPTPPPTSATTSTTSNNAQTANAKQHQPNNVQQQQKPRKQLKIISNDGNVFIKDLNSVHCRHAQDAYQLLAAGLTHLTYATTNINQNSSRSHCIFFVDVIKNNSFEFEHVTYKFCDLAGSERLKKTDNVGNRLKEAQSINNSLMVLGRCLDAVYHKQSIVPIRDSKLTVLLQSSLLGREKIKMIVNMQPSVEYLDENLNVLNFASMAKQIVYKPPTAAELRKRQRKTARYSWFIENAASSSPVRAAGKKAKQPLAAAGKDGRQQKQQPALKAQQKQKSQEAVKPSANKTEEDDAGGDADAHGESYIGDTTQISVLLDENDRLKLDNEDLQEQLDLWRTRWELREREVRSEMIAEWELRTKSSTDLWNKRVEFMQRDHEMQLNALKDNHKRIVARLEQQIEKLRNGDAADEQEGDDGCGDEEETATVASAAVHVLPSSPTSERRASTIFDLTADSDSDADDLGARDGADGAETANVVQEVINMNETPSNAWSGDTDEQQANNTHTVLDLTEETGSSSSSEEEEEVQEPDEEEVEQVEIEDAAEENEEAERDADAQIKLVSPLKAETNSATLGDEPPEKRNRLSE